MEDVKVLACLASLFLCYWVLLVEGTDSLLSPKGVNYEVAALMSMKSKMYDEFHVMHDWDINSVDPCTWYMVGCSAEGYVISLEMASAGLSGTISSGIGNLSHLHTLLLQNNKLSGPIPTEIGKLLELQTLDLFGKQLGLVQSSAMALLLRLNRRRATSSRTLFFSTSNSDSNSGSNSPFSSLFRDVRECLKQPSSPSSNPRSQPPSANEIRKNLSEFRAKTAPPPPGNPSQQQQQFSFQQIYQRHNVQGNPPRLGESSSPNIQFIRESLRNLSAPQTPVSQGRPGMIGGTNALPQNIFGKEMRKEGTKSTTMFSAGFLKTYNVEDLGKKLRMLRPQGKEKGWFSVRELSERLVRLRKMEEEQARSNTRDSTIEVIRGCLAEINEEQNLTEKKASLQGHSILNHLSGAPTFSLEPPIPHLVEKYFHPDNMSSAEKMKIELAKVRDEFKMSESDCGSARVQIAQLTTKIKHLSAVLHKKDVHSRKGLVAMVQRRKRLLKYLRRTDWDSYCFVISKLGLRDNPDHSYRSRTSMAT